MMNDIEPTELKNINGEIIDIRDNIKYNIDHIPTAINIPTQKLIMQPEKYINKNQTYYIYCQKGITSLNICRILTLKGYKTINVKGGYENWITNNQKPKRFLLFINMNCK